MQRWGLLCLIGMLGACTPAIVDDRPLGADTREQFARFPVRTANVNGVSLAFVEDGSGPPVVLLHGSVGDYRSWADQVGPLARRFRVVAYSRRYHPPNPQPNARADASVDRQVEDLAALIETLRLPPAHLVGHSYGGTIAAAFALRHPDRVRSLVLADPGLGSIMADTPFGAAQAAEARAVRDELAAAFASGNPERIVRTYGERVAPGTFDRLDAAATARLLDNARAFELDLMAPRPRLSCADLARIAVPVLVIKGSRSPDGMRRIADTTAACIPAGRLVELPGATHWMHLEQPGRLNEVLLEFLTNQPRE